MDTKKRSGRPKKAEHEKVKNQLIAVDMSDYLRLKEAISNRDVKLKEAFAEMVTEYTSKH